MTWNDGNRYVVHPGQELELLDLQTDMEFTGPVDFTIRYFAYADGMAAQAGELTITTV